ncbi:MAG: hypothetical protein Ct9H90mP19_2810 [Gammaproteobacteria bacterium]|nr:MAG: hypothetical protein Ct9H90mP19_2810 [Gammaproteobacteria bacterium]
MTLLQLESVPKCFLEFLKEHLPELIGGSADLSGSNKQLQKHLYQLTPIHLVTISIMA